MPSILIIEDDVALRTSLAKLFAKEGYNISETGEYREARKLLESGVYDLVLTDLRLDLGSGLEILHTCKKAHSETEVIIFTAYASVQTAVEAIQSGAADYITKPFKNEELLFKVKKSLERIKLRNEVKYLRQEVASRFGFDNIIGNSKAMEDLKKIIGRITDTDITVLITGDSGTGKELFAKVIHHHSRRRDKPFIPINCSAIPENLMESELFGHVKGAFTSAMFNKRGLFEEADQGTIFLDEIGDLPYSIQAKLLRVLQEQEIRPVGGNISKVINVRIIAATNADLTKRVHSGEFREDLFYRLNVMPIHIPPLRERPEDIPALTEHVLRKIEKEYNQRSVTLSADSLELLLRHDWPGNIRELENTLKRAVALSGGGQIKYEDIIFISPRESKMPRREKVQGKSLVESQKLTILRTLEENNWNYTITAGRLGIGRTTLWRKVKRFNLKQMAGQKRYIKA
jgi:DNA-binding NtrC family response regulator